MKKPLIHAISGIILFSALHGFSAVKPGDDAPDFTAKDLDGAEHKLSDHKGKYVVLEWISYACPFVKKYYKNGDMQKLQKTWAAKGVVWFSVCSSGPGQGGNMPVDKWKQIMAQNGAAPNAMLLDDSGEVGRLYGARTTPHLFVINPEGKLIYQGAIDSIASTNPDDIEKAENYVNQALDASMAGKPVATPYAKPYGCGVKYAQQP